MTTLLLATDFPFPELVLVQDVDPLTGLPNSTPVLLQLLVHTTKDLF